jgi:cell wall-associated NlpC family hydrolase
MTLEAFVRASGAVMGLARDSFGVKVGAGAGLASPSGPSPTLAAAVFGSGRAAWAANNESKVVDGQVSALGEQDLAVNADLDSALAAAGVGREQMDAVIAAALADISSLAPATTTPAGQQALVNALAVRLEQTWQALTNGNADASTRAASSAQVAAAYSGLGNYPVGGLAPTLPMSYAGAMSPLGAMSPMQTMPMLAAESMAANQAALSAAQAASVQQQSASNGGGQTATLTSGTKSTSEVNAVIQRAMKERGVPYSWGGGGTSGPTLGLPGTSGANTVGFDCSGLVRYAYWPYVHLPRDTYGQINVGTTVSPTDIHAGDLIFSNFGENDKTGPGHVQLAISHTQVVEAPYPGTNVRVTGIAPGTIVVKRILS